MATPSSSQAVPEQLPETAAHAQLAKLYAAHGREVLAYALRRARTPEDGADAVAETFLVAWRRLRDVPAEPESRLWLYGVARRALANQRRGADRQDRLAERLRAEARVALEATPPQDRNETVLTALAALSPDDRELLLLIGWEELTPVEAARVLGISAVAARVRLHRARRRLDEELGGSTGD